MELRAADGRRTRVVLPARCLPRRLGDQSGRAHLRPENYLAVRGYLSEGRRLFDSAVARGENADRRLRASLCVHGATFPSRQGDSHTEAAEIQRKLEDFDNLAITLHNVGRGHIVLGNLEEGRSTLEKSFELAQKLGLASAR